MPVLANRYVATAISVSTIGFFALLRVDGRPAGIALWGVFGTTNQVLAGLTLLTVTLYLFVKRKNCLYTALPMVFMMVTTLVAMVSNVRTFYLQKNYLLLGVGATVLLMAVWLVVEGVVRFTRGREGAAAGLEEALS